MAKVKIKSLGKGGGFNEDKFPWPSTGNTTDQAPNTQVNKTLKPVDKDEANIEAEKGETIMADMNHDGVMEHYTIGGERHSNGGTPLNVPDDAFIFSDTKKSKIKDENILKMFGMSLNKTGGYTPADIAKKYDINKYQQMLADPDTDDIQRKTAESMIANYNLKLAKLALVQESKKGFPTGIPTVAMPYIEQSQINPQDFFTTESTQEQPNGNFQFGGDVIGRLLSMKMGGMPKYQDAGQVKTTKVPNIPKDTKIKNMGDPTLAVGDYVYVGGVPKKVTSLPPKADFVDPRIGGLQNEYAYLQNTLKDPELQDKIYENYRKHIEATPDKNMSPARKKALLAKSKEDVVSNYLNFQKQTYAIHNAGVDLQGEDAKNWDTGKYGKNRMYKETMEKLGFKPDEVLSDDQIAMAQSAHLGIADAYDDPNYRSKLEKFGKQINAGRSDQQYKGKNISPVDDWFGNTTAGQAFVPEGQEPGLEDVGMIDQVIPQEKAKAIQTNPLVPPAQQASPAPWWLQDVIKTAGAAGDFLRVKKYNPWQATPGVEFTDPTFYDPTRELASNAEQLNIVTQNLSTFTGPQSYMSNASAAQGNAARNAADIMGRYNNLNVGVANQSDSQNANTYNQASAQKAALDTQLYDKYTIANQQFDNAKNMARQNLRQSYMDAITNKNYTANLNDLYPQYNIDPSIGGRIHFTQGRELDPSMANNPSVMAKAQEYKRMYPSFDDKTAFEAAKIDMGLESPGSKQHNEKLRMLNALMSGQYQGE